MPEGALRIRAIAKSAVFGACITLLAGSSVSAQSTEWSDRAFFNINFGYQLTARPFAERLAPVIYSERAAIDASHPGDGGKLTLDLAGGVHIWKNLGIGGAFTKFAATETLTVGARVPNPSYFNQPRVTSKAAPFQRNDSAIHLQALYVVPVSSRIDVTLSAGPSVINVQQDLVQSIDVAEGGPPFTSVAIGNVALLSRTLRVHALNFGGDATWFVKPLLGVGITARYLSGSVTTQLSDGSPIDLTVGAFQIGFGARIRLR